MNKTRSMLCIAAALLLAACTQDTVDIAAEKERLMQLSRDWSAIVNSGDIDAIVAHWDDDAVMLPPDSPIIEGKEAIRSYVQAASAIPGFRISWEPESAFVAEAEDMAYMIERNEITINDENGEPVTLRGKVVTVWKKDAAGASNKERLNEQWARASAACLADACAENA